MYFSCVYLETTIFKLDKRLSNQFKGAIQMFDNLNFISIRFQENFPPCRQTDQNTFGNCRFLHEHATMS